MIVYKHVCRENGKVYIGITSQPPDVRWRQGEGYRTNPEFYKDIQAFGWDNFDHIILENDLTLKEAEEKEIEYIRMFDSVERGQNRNYGGSGFAGCRHSEETKAIQRMKLVGANNPNYQGKNCTDEWRRRQSESHKGKTLSPEHRKRISDGVRGKIHHDDIFKDDLRKRSSKKIMRSDGAVYSSCVEAGRQNGVSGSAISHSIKRQNRSAGYYWSYVEMNA